MSTHQIEINAGHWKFWTGVIVAVITIFIAVSTGVGSIVNAALNERELQFSDTYLKRQDFDNFRIDINKRLDAIDSKLDTVIGWPEIKKQSAIGNKKPNL